MITTFRRFDDVCRYPHPLVRMLDRVRVEKYPFGLLTMIVSLEAIFLSTFVMISQNRADAKRQVIADQQWRTVQDEDEQNKRLLGLSRQILGLTKEVRGFAGLAQQDHERNEQLWTCRRAPWP